MHTYLSPTHHINSDFDYNHYNHIGIYTYFLIYFLNYLFIFINLGVLLH